MVGLAALDPPYALGSPCRIRRRRGISLLEVLFAGFVLTVGLLGAASLIPAGTSSVDQALQADRVAACGRAALREIKVQRLLDYRNWRGTGGAAVAGALASVPPFVLDPLGVARFGGYPNFGGTGGTLLRYSLVNSAGAVMSANEAEAGFTASDDLVFRRPEEETGLRPRGQYINGTTMTDAAGTSPVNASEGAYSWFLTVVPSRIEEYSGGGVNALKLQYRRKFEVSVVVCRGRNFEITGAAPKDEMVRSVTYDLNISNPFATSADPTWSGSIRLSAPIDGVRVNDWIMLVDANSVRAAWYRIALAENIDSDGDDKPDTAILTLVGPDWGIPSNRTQAVYVRDVKGVYTTTVEFDDDMLFNQKMW